jgi:hypothetical protein
MKTDYRDTCDEIKLMKSKLADGEQMLENLRQKQTSLARRLAVKGSDLRIDVNGCLPLRTELSVDTRGGPVVKIPLLHSS